MPFYEWPTDRTRKLLPFQAEDVILHCKMPADDAHFAECYGVTRHTIGEIRRGRTWHWLREKLREAGRI